MPLTESIVEEAALTWFPLRQDYGGQVGELGYSCLGGEALTSTLSQGERESYGEVVLVGRLREALRQLNPAIHQSRTLATLRDTLLPKLLSGELSVAGANHQTR